MSKETNETPLEVDAVSAAPGSGSADAEAPESAEVPETDAGDVVARAAEEEPTVEAEPVTEEALPEPAAAPVAEEPTVEQAAAVVEPAASQPSDQADKSTATPPATDESSPSVSAKRKRKRLPRALRRTRSTAKREAPASRRPIVRLEKPEHERGRRQERQGKVVSDAMDKTIVVKVEIAKVHPRYKKVVRRTVKFHAHDERGEAKLGDVVRIVETRPLSKTKRWRLVEIVEAAR